MHAVASVLCIKTHIMIQIFKEIRINTLQINNNIHMQMHLSFPPPCSPHITFLFSCDPAANLSQAKAGLQFLHLANIFRETLSTAVCPGSVLEIVIKMQQIYRHIWSSIQVFIWNTTGKKQHEWHRQNKKNNQLQTFKTFFFFF